MHLRQPVLVLILLPLVYSCGQSERLAANVNGTGISVERLRQALFTANAQGAQTVTPTQAVEVLIDQELLAQKALKLKMDRDPKIRSAIETATTQILARAYVERLAASIKEDDQKVKVFYRENPALFQQRRIYRLFEVAVKASEEDTNALKTAASKARSLSELTDWLQSRNLGFTLGATTKAAEQIPLSLLPRLAAMRDGQIDFFAVPGGATVLQLVQSQSAPVEESQAAPMIDQHLLAMEREQLATAELKKLRSAASIDYVIDFGGERPTPSVDSTSVVDATPIW